MKLNISGLLREIVLAWNVNFSFWQKPDAVHGSAKYSPKRVSLLMALLAENTHTHNSASLEEI